MMKVWQIDRNAGREYEALLSLYGGRQCAALFPRTYAQLERAAQFSSADGGGDALLRLLSAGYAGNGAIELTAELRVSAKFYKRLDILAYRKDAPEVLIASAHSAEFVGDYACAKLLIPREYRENCLVDLVGVDVSDAVRLLWRREDLSEIGLADADVSFKVNDPIQKRRHPQPDQDKIVVSFLGGSWRDADYPYSYYWGPFKLPSVGRIRLENREFDTVESTSLLICQETTQRCEEHRNLVGVSCAGNTLEWSFPEDWGFHLDRFSRASSDLRYELQFTCRLRGERQRYFFTVTNNPEVPQGAQNYKIMGIRYYCDCIAAGSRVTLADHTAAPIEQIGAEQMLAGGSRVAGIIRAPGAGASLLTLSSGDGRRVTLSSSHCVRTERGWVPAGMLAPGAVLVMGDGKAAVLKEVTPAQDTEVCNLLLEGGDEIIDAEGFALRGLTRQGMRAPDKAARRAMVPEEWLDDFDSLCRLEAGERLWR